MTKIQNILKRYNLRPSKRLGQNFLVDKSVLRRIINAAELKSNDIVLEIGPGLGVLTIELAKRVKKVIAIEKDRILCRALMDILKIRKINNVKVINKDVLQISNFKAQISNQIQNSNYKLVANLPYYITSSVIKKFLEAGNKPELMILMVQKEVAQRIIAKPPHMNILAISVQFYAVPEIISFVSKKSFYPQPKVDSAIIKITPKKAPEINTEKFFNLVKIGFSAKRKILVNNLARGFKIQNSKFKILLEDLGLNPKSRAQDLSIKDWVNLYENLKK